MIQISVRVAALMVSLGALLAVAHLVPDRLLISKDFSVPAAPSVDYTEVFNGDLTVRSPHPTAKIYNGTLPEVLDEMVGRP